MKTDDSDFTPVSSWGRLGRAVRAGGFRDPGYWTWCGSVIRGDDGRYHMFSSRWRKEYGFHNWNTHSEVVRAVADQPEGPYTFVESVLPPRGAQYWDGKMTHNPTIHRCGDTFLLYYTGVTYPWDFGPGEPITPAQRTQVMHSKQIGLATAPSPEGPWTRADAPILQVRKDHWDNYFVSNAAPVVHADCSVLLVYKGLRITVDVDTLIARGEPFHLQTKPAQNLHLGVARAAHWSGPYERPGADPILKEKTFDLLRGWEDPYAWHNGTHYELVAKDMTGEICGEHHGGLHAWSRDGLTWQLYDPPLAYSRKLRWDDGTEAMQGQLERCELLIENGRPTHMFAACGDGPGGFGNMTHSVNVCIPFERD